LMDGGEENLRNLIKLWKEQTATILALLGKQTLQECSLKDLGNK